jgi:hypothetical protein
VSGGACGEVESAAIVIRVVFEDRYVAVTLDQAHELVRYVRSREPYPSLESMRASNAATDKAAAWIPRAGLKLLLDLRDAPPRNDDGFEKEASRALNGFLPTFNTYAVLVKTAVGRLQAQRMARTEGGERFSVFTSEADALAHLGVV